jgi:hypothetical protein
MSQTRNVDTHGCAHLTVGSQGWHDDKISGSRNEYTFSVSDSTLFGATIMYVLPIQLYHYEGIYYRIMTGFIDDNSSCGANNFIFILNISLRAGRSGDRIPVGARFSASVQNGPGAHPASCTMGTGSFQGVKRPGRGADHPPHLCTEVMQG